MCRSFWEFWNEGQGHRSSPVHGSHRRHVRHSLPMSIGGGRYMRTAMGPGQAASLYAVLCVRKTAKLADPRRASDVA